MKQQTTILQEIFNKKRLRIENAKKSVDYKSLVSEAKRSRQVLETKRLCRVFANQSRINIISEIKRASPSKGLIKKDLCAEEIARTFEKFGASAISILTEEDFFHGGIEDLLAARSITNLPILRKDFIFDEFQIFESALIGADAILLIASMLDNQRLKNLCSLANDLGLDVLVEVHNLSELERVKELHPQIIGVNNRNLNTFEVSLDTSRELIKHAPKDAIMICESGLSQKGELIEMKELGFDGFLIGESLMRSGDLKNTLRRLAARKTEF